MITVYKVTDLLSGETFYRLSIAGILQDVEIPIDCTARHFSRLAKSGYPFEHSGCRIEKFQALSTNDVRENNPPMFKKNSSNKKEIL